MYAADDAVEIRVQGWRTLMALHCALEIALEKALRQHGLSVVEYTVLETLGRQGGWHLRMQQISSAAALSHSATTRLINRLERRGLLARSVCTTDRRGVVTELTAAGRELLRIARPVHDSTLDAALDRAADDSALAPLVAALDGAHRPLHG
ncbi:MarR family transcriptional regulator [Streptomyces olivoreticuli]|uniref:MarR family winged helix-turn-helix transcriptional regulator n=1 Tax=Streptomyces olivoreticuli TaxID=68246 RepID=UPI000E251DCA|nr:MarR family transcriptional regulator [Streptomyces olivoreticuli]